ncbi:MAG: hypothetical protein HYT83_01580, partial [Candidatus Levybacteria bacterium]|nr:hypothetical protein [Candidatus Levybacteria bacterium]
MANNLNTMEEIKSLQPDSLRWKNLVAYFADDKRGRVNLNTLPDGEVLKLISTSNLNLDITSTQDVLNWRAADQRLIALANLAVPTETSSVGREYSGGLGSGAYNVLGAVIAPFMGKKPELMEQDSAYQKIREEKIKDWQKQHPGKNIYETKEGLNYLFGSLDNPNEPTLANDTEKAFREKNPKKTDAYDKKKKKIEKDNAKDAAVIQTQALIKQHTDYRYKQVYNNAAAPKLSRKAIEAKVAKREWETFIRKYPEKAAAYAQNNASIQKALAAVKQADAAKKSLKKAEEEKKSPIAKPTPAQPAETQEQTKIQAEPIATQTVIISTQEAPAPSGIQESMSSPKEPQIEEPTTQQPPTSTTQDQSGSRVSRAINALNAARSKQKKEAEEKTAKALLKKSIFKNPAFLYAIGIFTLITIVII